MSECIIWNKAKNKAGYGITWHNRKWAYAHRVAVNADKHEIVRHVCDNPSCVNPEHLKKGTAADNSADMVSKQRQAHGEKAARSKLTAHDVIAIRALYFSSRSSRDVAKMFNISKTNVLDIWNRKTWKYV